MLLTITSVANPELNIFVLFQFTAFLLFYMSVKHIYKQLTVRLLESATLLNLIVLSAGTLYKWESTQSKSTLLETSMGIIFAQFCVIIVLSFIKACHYASCRYRRNQGHDTIDENTDSDIACERIEDPELEPLMDYTSQTATMAISAQYTATDTKSAHIN